MIGFDQVVAQVQIRVQQGEGMVAMVPAEDRGPGGESAQKPSAEPACCLVLGFSEILMLILQ